MKTAFGCINAKLYDASLVLLYIHLLLFGWMLHETLTMPDWFWTLLLFFLVFLAGILSLITKQKKSTHITLTMAFVILFFIAFILIGFIAFFNIAMIFCPEEVAERSMNETLQEIEEDHVSNLSEVRAFLLLVNKMLKSKITLCVIDCIVFSIIAFYVYSALVMKSYVAELKQKPQSSEVRVSAGKASELYVYVPQEGVSVSVYPAPAPDMNHVKLEFSTLHQQQHPDQFDKQPLV